MSRASISTGNITFQNQAEQSRMTPKPRDAGTPFHIVVIGDFSGRGSRGEFDPVGLATRKVIEVDRDNFEEVFSQLGVRLRLPISDEDIHFREFDDLHPDVLVERLSLFSNFQTLKTRLQNPQHFDAAMSEIQSWQAQPEAAAVSDDDAPEGIALPSDMLEAIFSQHHFSQHQAREQNPAPLGNVQQLIQEIVSPYAQKKLDPRLPDMLEAVDEAIAQSLRTIMHASDFQELEANWRGLYLLIRRLETDRHLKLFIIDVSRDELIDDVINHNEFDDTALYKRLVESYRVPGMVPFSCLQFNVTIEDDIDDLQLAASMANIASVNQAIALAAGSEKLAGCRSLVAQEDVDDWDYILDEEFASAWAAFREDELSRHLALAAPRFLLRLPYGKHTAPIEHFDFSELSDADDHRYYLWGNSAHLITLLLAENYQKQGSLAQAAEVDDLPLHVSQRDNESVVTPCAEIFIRDSAVQRFAAAGLLTIRSVQGKAAVLVPAMRTVSLKGEKIFS